MTQHMHVHQHTGLSELIKLTLYPLVKLCVSCLFVKKEERF